MERVFLIMKQPRLTSIPLQRVLIYVNMCKYGYLCVDMSCAGTRDYNYYSGFLGGDTQSAPARQSRIPADEPADAPAAGMTTAENDIMTSPTSTFQSILTKF